MGIADDVEIAVVVASEEDFVGDIINVFLVVSESAIDGDVGCLLSIGNKHRFETLGILLQFSGNVFITCNCATVLAKVIGIGRWQSGGSEIALRDIAMEGGLLCALRI